MVIDEPAIDQRLLDALAVELRLLQHVLDLRGLKHSLLDENISDLLRVHVFIRGAQAGSLHVSAACRDASCKARR